jgi:hypothetical protein
VGGERRGKEKGKELDNEAHVGVVKEGHECVEAFFCFCFALEISESQVRAVDVPFRPSKVRCACVKTKRSILGFSPVIVASCSARVISSQTTSMLTMATKNRVSDTIKYRVEYPKASRRHATVGQPNFAYIKFSKNDGLNRERSRTKCLYTLYLCLWTIPRARNSLRWSAPAIVC